MKKRFLMKANGQYRKIGENIVIPNISPEIVSQTLQGPCTISSEKNGLLGFPSTVMLWRYMITAT